MAGRLITKTEMAALAGVSPAAITKASRKQISAAMVRDRVNIDHKDVAAYLATRGISVPPRPGKREPEPSPVAACDADEAIGRAQDIGIYADLPHRKVVEMFGAGRAMRDWLLALKDLDALRERRMRMEMTRGALVDRAMVETHVYGTLDACNRQLLHDSAPAIVHRLFDMVASGATREEAETVVCELISDQLKLAYGRTERVLRDQCEARFTDEPYSQREQEQLAGE